ncbi:hypothetical protein AGR1A_Lc60010 [Agrobacterium fabacearum CFBP 5771]|nr:hypothetical protein AGR1B_Lc40010 [Agrobacterium fabacearum S56]CVI21679.1 hypothetical protein AGR1A_Lc60010 [Agrobacterium fabacearum CFBP 5771]
MVHKRHCVPPAFSLRDPQLEALYQKKSRLGLFLSAPEKRLAEKRDGTGQGYGSHCHEIRRHVRREPRTHSQCRTACETRSGCRP